MSNIRYTDRVTLYKHTQISYPMLAITIIVLAFFVRIQMLARAEPPSPDSGANFAVTLIMVLIVLLLLSFSTLTVSVDDRDILVRFGIGIFRKHFPLSEIATAVRVRNRWYYGWGIRLRLWPTVWIYNVSGLDAVELTMKNGRLYRIGTNEPDTLENHIKQRMIS